MVKAQKGEGEASSKSERDDKQVGGDKAKIAQLEEEKSKLGQSAPDVTPHQNPELSAAEGSAPAPRQVAAGAARPDAEAARADARDGRPVAAARGRRRDAAPLARRAREQERPLASRQRQAGEAGLHRQGLRVPVRRRRRGRAEAGAADALDAAGEVPEAPGARAVGRRELRPRGEAGQPDGAQHARRAVRRLSRAHAPEHPRAVGLRSARGVGREAGLEPLQQPEPGHRAGVRVERRRDDRSDRRRADRRACSSTTSPPSTSPTPPGRSPIPRARSARPTGRSTSTGTSSGTSGSARPRGPTLHPRKCLGRRRQDDDGARPAPTALRGRCGCRTRCGPPGGAPAAGTTAGGPRRLQRFDDTNSAHRAKRMALDGEVAAAEGSEGHSRRAAPVAAGRAGGRAAERR